MPDRICYLHVGTIKTGSSALQYALAQSQNELVTRGYSFPDRPNRLSRMKQGGSTGGNASEIQRALNRRDVASALEFVTLHARIPHHLIFSNEVLFRSAGVVMDEFCDGLRKLGFRPKCFVVFRPQTDLVVSAYLQLMKSGTSKLPRTLDQYASTQDFQHARNWNAYARQLEASFGAENLLVKWYPALVRSGGIIMAAFGQWLHLPVPQIKTPNINPTPGREAFAILQIVNSAGWGSRKFGDQFLLEAEKEGLLGSKITLDPQTAHAIHEATLASNEALLRHFCPELSVADELKPPVSCGQNKPDKKTLHKLAKMATELLVQNGHNCEFVERAFGDFLS